LKVVRFLVREKVKYGVLKDDMINCLRGSPFLQIEFDGSVYKLDEVRLLAPCYPSKIVAIGLNYRTHAEETRLPIPPVPLIFLKPSTSVIGPDDKIVLPRNWKRVDYEGELGVVIGKKAKDVPKEHVRDYILGYTCFNDISERVNQRDDVQWTRAKGYDTFAPMGPWIETEVSPDNLKLETYLNGELRQSARTSELIFGVAEIVSFISGVMTLLPGDVIATGTPAGIGKMKPGDAVEVRIENIGTLRNSVAEQG